MAALSVSQAASAVLPAQSVSRAAYKQCQCYTYTIQMVHIKKRKDYAFQRQFNERPSVLPGCPGRYTSTQALLIVNVTTEEWLQNRAKHLPGSDLQAELMVC